MSRVVGLEVKVTATASWRRPALGRFGALLLGASLWALGGCSDSDGTTESSPHASADGGAGSYFFGDGFASGPGGGADVQDADPGWRGGACEFAPSPDKGQPGAPCDEQEDCDSGLCVEGPEGRICSRICVQCCPSGFKCEQWAKADADFICLPKLAALCRPCVDDAECAGINEGALCISYGEAVGRFCGGECADAGDCPAGYACEQAKGTKGEGKQCVRQADECACSERSVLEGAQTVCAVSNALGTCVGLRKCTAGGLGACDAVEAIEEVCDGADNDCDGETDEDIAPVACDVEGAAGGKCKGKEVCKEGEPVCEGQTPSEEVCDGLDNDCDDQTDEGFGDLDGDGQADCVDGDKDGDGAKNGEDCAPEDKDVAPGKVEVCDGKDDDCDGQTDEEGATGCKKLWIDADNDGFGNNGSPKCLCKPEGGYDSDKSGDCKDDSQAVHPGAIEKCDGLDNDCVGGTDEGFALGGACEAGQGGCKQAGTFVCKADGSGTECSAKGGGGGAEKCNGADDDCDGATDEGFALGGACEVGEGVCKAIGKLVCAPGGAGTACSAKAGQGGAEKCNGLDDDCDGKTDELFAGAGQACTSGKGACKQSGAFVCSDDGLSLVCSAKALAPSGEKCDGVDNDCDGVTDEGCDDDGDGYCDKKMAYVNDAACSKGPGDCDDTKATVRPGAKELCDGVDNDCDGVKDGFKESCSNACGSGTRTCTKGTWQSCTAPKPQCTSGPCCDGCKLRPPTYKCSATPYKTSYRCSAQTCGGKIKRYRTYRYCTGKSSTCGTSNLKKLYAGTYKSCGSGQLCTNIGSSGATCKTCSGVCSGSTCVNQPVRVICIDPGFGGSQTGAVGNGLVEKVLNLLFAKDLRAWLEKDTANGSGGGTWKVVMTRTGDTNPSVSTRAAICNGAKAQRVVSIFTNSFYLSAAKGTETYYYKTAGASTKAFCTTLHNNIVSHAGLYNRGVKPGSYTILAKTWAPACLTLAGFLSNSGDAAKLKSASWRKNVALGMLHGLQQSFGYKPFTPP